MKKKFLVLKVVTAKTGKFYAVGRFASVDKNEWIQKKSGDSWGDAMIEITKDQADKISPKILSGCILDAEVKAYNDYDYPIYKLSI